MKSENLHVVSEKNVFFFLVLKGLKHVSQSRVAMERDDPC